MFAIIGILGVFGAVAGGYLIEKGNLVVLLQPGAAAGTLLIANPPRILTTILKGVVGIFTGSRYTKQWHLNSLKLRTTSSTRRGGLASLEAEIEEPSKSKTLSTQPAIAKDHHIGDFICDTASP